MDFHFVLPNDSEEEEKKPNDRINFGKLLGRLTPVFLLAALLPMFLFFVSTPADLKFLTRASRESELRIWTEPAQVIANPNSSLVLDVYAQFESESLLPGVSLEAESQEFEVAGGVTYLKPFNGQLKIGTISITTGVERGEFQVIIPEESVSVTAFEDPLEIITSPTTIYVQ